ncbi:MAG: hypothetical protein KDA89_15355, partial [Planctomycetaceae bacterium]|nr:hypothetical protein [Planctomycetaceae bacterium]
MFVAVLVCAAFRLNSCLAQQPDASDPVPNAGPSDTRSTDPTTSEADETAVADAAVVDDVPGALAVAKSGSGAEIRLLDVRCQSFQIDRLQGQIEVRIAVTNQSQQPLQLQQDQFRLQAPVATNLSLIIGDPLLTGPVTLPVGESAEGWIAFNMIYGDAAEPELNLMWVTGDETLKLSVNDALRNPQTGPAVIHQIGPRMRLAVIEFEHPLDNLAVWLLNDIFTDLERTGVRRVVLDVHEETKSDKRMAGALYSRGLVAWLLTAVRNGERRNRFQVPLQIRSPVEFDEFHVVGSHLKLDRAAYFLPIAGLIHSQRADAVSAALAGAYRDVSLEEALADFSAAEEGIRIEAVQSNIDRLTVRQLKDLVEDQSAASASILTSVANHLDLVSDPDVVEIMAGLANHPARAVADSALRSLVRSATPGAAKELQKCWNRSELNSTVQQTIVREVMNTKDYRHTDLLFDYARRILADDSETSQTEEAAESPPIGDRNAAGDRKTIADSRTLRDILSIVRDEDKDAFRTIAERYVLLVSRPDLQDLLISFLLEVADEPAIPAKRYIAQRLPIAEETASDSSSSGESSEDSSAESGSLTPEQKESLRLRFGPRGESKFSGITNVLLDTIRRFPEP